MKAAMAVAATAAVLSAFASTANAQEAPQYAPAVPPQQEALPPQVTWTQAYPTGQWVYTVEYGWIWVPNGAATSVNEGVPYVYLFTPTYGWTWYVSPWGPGPYRYGPWVRHVWRPVIVAPRVWGPRPHIVLHHGGGWHRHR